jgi:copper chaperone CopZ
MNKQTTKIAMILLAFVLFTASLLADEIKILSNPHCGACKEKIEKALNNVPGVEKSNVDVESKVVTVNYDAGKTKPESLLKTVADLGFTASLIDDNATAGSAKKDKCCKVKKEMKDKCCKDKSKAKSDCCKDKKTKKKCDKK